MGPSLNGIVITTDKLEEMKDFYTKLGFVFTKERHGEGVEHYSATLSDGKVVEIYPRNKDTQKQTPTGSTSFGGMNIFDVESLWLIADNLHISITTTKNASMFDGREYSKLRDPDNRLIMLVERIK